MKMMERENLSREKILRLGTPTKVFADEFGDVCEVTGIQKKLDEIDSQLAILDKVAGVKIEEGDLQDLRSEIVAYPDRLQQLNEWLAANVIQLKEIETRRRKKAIDVAFPDKELAEIAKKKKALVQKRDSFWTKVAALVGKGPASVQGELDTLERRRVELEKEMRYHQPDLDRILDEERAATGEKNELLKEQQEMTEQLIAKVREHEWMIELLGEDADEVLATSPGAILKKIDEKTEALETEAALMEEYAHLTSAQLQAERSRYEKERARLAAYSTAERIENASIVAATLDTYLGRYKDTKLPVDHLFLDEAGYANQVKALTLFNHEVPVTFLGDHMQLPPVCEVNDLDIEKTPGFENVYLWAESALHLGLLFEKHTSLECRHFYLNSCQPTSKGLSRTQLTSTHRFGPALADVLGEFVYDGKFFSAVTTGDTQIKVIAAKKKAEDEKRTSLGEVEAIGKLLTGLKDYVILTPYRKQVSLLKSHLPDARNAECILTIHKSQGREWDTVILSVADQSPSWFTDTHGKKKPALNVINTAVSRAKRELIIVCNEDNWGKWPGQLLHGLVSVAEPVVV